MKRSHNSVRLYVDGACQPNPGKGGWAFVVVSEGCQELQWGYGGVEMTTNNRMEVGSILKGLLAARTFSDNVHVVSDSQYALGYLKNVSLNKGISANPDLQAPMARAIIGLQLTLEWVKGHSGNRWNERCDELSNDLAANGPWVIDRGYMATMAENNIKEKGQLQLI